MACDTAGVGVKPLFSCTIHIDAVGGQHSSTEMKAGSTVHGVFAHVARAGSALLMTNFGDRLSDGEDVRFVEAVALRAAAVAGYQTSPHVRHCRLPVAAHSTATSAGLRWIRSLWRAGCPARGLFAIDISPSSLSVTGKYVAHGHR